MIRYLLAGALLLLVLSTSAEAQVFQTTYSYSEKFAGGGTDVHHLAAIVARALAASETNYLMAGTDTKSILTFSASSSTVAGATGDLFMIDNSAHNYAVRFPVGSPGQILGVNSGLPFWTTSVGATDAVITDPSTPSDRNLIQPTGAGVENLILKSQDDASLLLEGRLSNDAQTFSLSPNGDILSLGRIDAQSFFNANFGFANAGLLYSDATGLFNSLPNGTSGYILASTGSAPSWITKLGIAHGGTNAASFNTNGIIGYDGSALNSTVLTNGQLLIGWSGNAPVAAALTAGSNITITGGSGSITIAATGADSNSLWIRKAPFTSSENTILAPSGLAALNLHENSASDALLNWIRVDDGASKVIVNHSGTVVVGAGGLGITTTPSNGYIPIGNGTTYTAAAVTAGTGISITNGSGSITIANTGMSSNPMTNTGDIIYSSDNSGTPARLGIGASTTVLHGGTTPSYSPVTIQDGYGGSKISVTNAAASTTTYTVTETTNLFFEMNMANNGTGRSGTPTNGDAVIELPTAAIKTGMHIVIAVKPRTNAATAVVYMKPNGSDTINSQSATYNQSFLGTNSTLGSTETIMSDGVSNWYVLGHN